MWIAIFATGFVCTCIFGTLSLKQYGKGYADCRRDMLKEHSLPDTFQNEDAEFVPPLRIPHGSHS